MQLNPIYYNEQHIAFADNVRRFVQKEMAPLLMSGMRPRHFLESFIKGC